MRVISNFSDYYDGVLAYGHDDRDVVFNRREAVIYQEPLTGKALWYGDHKFSPEYRKLEKLFSNTCIHAMNYLKGNRIARFEIVTILLAGKAYGGIRVKISSMLETFDETFYDEEALFKFLEKHEVDVKDRNETMSRAWKRWNDPCMRTPREHLKLRGVDFSDVALTMKAPIIVVIEKEYREGNCAYANCRLEDYKFYRIMDAYTVFQEIDMFISGIMAPEGRPMVQIEDKYKILEHGFDKHSFRKSPEKNKGRK